LPQAAPDRYPDYHFLFIAPNLGADYLFDAARVYWDRFRPTVIVNFDLLVYIPPGRTVIVTALVLRDTAAQTGVDLARFRLDAYFDPIVRDTLEETTSVLNQRAGLAQPFGLPILSPTLTPPPLDVPIPTPILPPEVRGFATYTPSPDPSIPPTPTSTPDSSQPTPAPLQPTPGSVIGG